MTNTIRRHHTRIRLDADTYARPGVICSITMAVAGRRSIFTDSALAEAAVDVFRRRAGETGVLVYAYCLMPDHVHLLLGPSDRCDIVSFVGQYKNLVQRAAWKRGVTGRIWQVSFWDRFLRADEQVEQAVAYVLNNPVRAGLVSEWRQYPYAGSLVFEL
jgi:putative transposase